MNVLNVVACCVHIESQDISLIEGVVVRCLTLRNISHYSRRGWRTVM